jgi:hypothetical protein
LLKALAGIIKMQSCFGFHLNGKQKGDPKAALSIEGKGNYAEENIIVN